jgi:tRNA A-37 threonylcarbamoyl transferase component Bud32
MNGATIGQYRVTGLIGQGGMGAVYAGEHTLLGRPAAIKVLLPELSRKQDVVMRFFNEARAATAIRHPGIVEIYDFGWTPDGAAFIVMERLDGEALADRLARGRLAWPAAFAVARQIAGALAAAHAKGIVHRDLKPDNVFLVPDPEVPGGERIKLLDFGIAKLAGETTTAVNMTKTGSVMGTPTYMAPEQCRGVAVDHRADLYALGCVMFELCAGRPPFVGEGSGDVLAAHIHVPVPALAAFGVELPRPVEDIIRRLLAKLPGERPQTAEAVIRAIDAVATERVGTSTGMVSSVRRAASVVVVPEMTTLSGAASTQTGLAKRGRRTFALVAGGVVVAAIAAIAVVVNKPGPSGDARVPFSELQAKPAAAEPVQAEPVKATEPVKLEPVKAVEPAKVEPAKPVDPEPPKPAPEVAAPAPPPPPPTSVIDLDSNPPGAQVVIVGGPVLGKTPLHTTLQRATDATLVIRAAGYADQTVAFHAGKPLSDAVALVKLAAKPSKPAKPRDRDQSVNPFGD